MRGSRFSALGFSLLLSGTVHAAAFQFYELGAPIAGTAAVGQAVLPNDASVAYFNPALMTQLQSNALMLGSQFILPYTNFSKNSRTTFSGDNGGNAGSLTPGVDLYYVYRYSQRMRLGVSLTSPYGGMLNYTDGWVGRFIVQGVNFYTINLNPSIAWEFNKYLSAAFGAAIEYANLDETIALPYLPDNDGQANVKVSNTAGGVNAGILITPSTATQIGLAWRSRITHSFTGNTTFLRISDNPSTSTQLIMPQNVILSLSQLVTNRFKLVGELGWANWSAIKDTPVTIFGYTASTVRDWNNTWRAGLGGQYFYTPQLTLQAGASYDSSPSGSAHRQPDLPMDRQIRVGAGLMYTLIKAVKLGLSYEYINLGHANINNSSPLGTLSGSYWRNFANVFQASLNIEC